MNNLMEIKNWQNGYKSIWISPPSLIIPENPKKTLENLKKSEDYKESEVWLEIGTWSIEEMTLILEFFRSFKDVLRVLKPDEYIYTYFDFTTSPKDNSFDSIDDLEKFGKQRPDSCWFAIKIREDSFLEIWKAFLEFCLEWKFVFWYGPGLGKVDWFINNMT